MKKILFVFVSILCCVFILSAGCTDAQEPVPVDYSSVVGFWKGLPDSEGVSLGLNLGESGTGVYGYYSGNENYTIDIEWYEYGGKYYVHNSTANAGNVFVLSEDGKVLSSDDGDVLHRQI